MLSLKKMARWQPHYRYEFQQLILEDLPLIAYSSSVFMIDLVRWDLGPFPACSHKAQPMYCRAIDCHRAGCQSSARTHTFCTSRGASWQLLTAPAAVDAQQSLCIHAFVMTLALVDRGVSN